MDTTFLPSDQPTMHRQDFFRLVGTSIGAIVLKRCMIGCSDQADGSPPPTPTTKKVDFTLRLDDRANENLTVKGGYVIANGVIVAQTKDGRYIAVSANCTHQNTQLVYKSVENQFYCPLHLSRFATNGDVIAGPAVVPLTQYTVETNLAAKTIRVHN
ncbi:QcrA and Rieske domain-containing protein [Spirosoma aerolatum]|uniref:QcrA and Rieske domain-containing protein n=1 Tax=Spirosoma aerolatum TaxID=1211326 RepID=UPI001FE766FF|nr:Rieske 2Fe-2S domain-containing protein [Spirosoma aerolatum]